MLLRGRQTPLCYKHSCSSEDKKLLPEIITVKYNMHVCHGSARECYAHGAGTSSFPWGVHWDRGVRGLFGKCFTMGVALLLRLDIGQMVESLRVCC